MIWNWESFRIGNHLELGMIWNWESFGIGNHLELGIIWNWESFGIGNHLELGIIWNWESFGIGNHLELRMNVFLRKHLARLKLSNTLSQQVKINHLYLNKQEKRRERKKRENVEEKYKNSVRGLNKSFFPAWSALEHI
jgi:hypothetical protein